MELPDEILKLIIDGKIHEACKKLDFIGHSLTVEIELEKSQIFTLGCTNEDEIQTENEMKDFEKFNHNLKNFSSAIKVITIGGDRSSIEFLINGYYFTVIGIRKNRTTHKK